MTGSRMLRVYRCGIEMNCLQLIQISLCSPFLARGLITYRLGHQTGSYKRKSKNKKEFGVLRWISEQVEVSNELVLSVSNV